MLCCLIMLVSSASADVNVAVASNFANTARQLAREFEKTHDTQIVIVAGSSGKHYAQIVNGAPFDILLSADQQKPAKLQSANLLLTAPKTYALGRLALWTPRKAIDNISLKTVLSQNRSARIAMANPKLAPYGIAALETLSSTDPQNQFNMKKVIAENVSQAYQFAHSGNVDLAFVAVSQLQQQGVAATHWFAVPASKHSPILQDAALLKRASNNAQAHAFFNYLLSPATQQLISEAGYERIPTTH